MLRDDLVLREQLFFFSDFLFPSYLPVGDGDDQNGLLKGAGLDALEEVRLQDLGVHLRAQRRPVEEGTHQTVQ